MPHVREFNGQVIRRTIRVGDRIAVVLKSPAKGQPGQRLLLSVDEYRAGLKTRPARKTAALA